MVRFADTIDAVSMIALMGQLEQENPEAPPICLKSFAVNVSISSPIAIPMGSDCEPCWLRISKISATGNRKLYRLG